MTAQLYQLYCWTGTPTAIASEQATIWSFNLPESSGSGNRMLLRLIYPTQTAPTITDNNGNTWPATPTGLSSGGANDLAVWDLKNCNSGFTTITATFTGPTQPVGGELIEWSGLSTSLSNGGVQTSISQTQVGTAGITTGSFTPSPSNSGNGGYLIVSFYQDAFGNDAGPTQWNADVANGQAMLQGNSIWNATTGQGNPGASQFVIQSGSPAAINPKIFPVGDTTTAYNCLAIALPLDPAGGTPAPNVLRIAKMMKVATGNINNATSFKFNFPTVGNTRVFTTSVDDQTVTGIADTDSTYVGQGFGITRPAFYVAKNQLPDAANIITVTPKASSTNNMDCVLFDIQNAATGTVVGAKGNNTVSTTATQTSITNSPNITPTTTNSIILVSCGNGFGPTLAPTSPSGARFGNVTLDKGGANAVTNATTAAGNAILHFASVPSTIVNGTFVQDASTPAAIPGTTVLSQTSTTVTLNANVVTPGVGSGDTITFTSESDAGTINSGDAPGGGILHNTSTAAQSWSWGIIAPGASGGGSSVNSSAIEILAGGATPEGAYLPKRILSPRRGPQRGLVSVHGYPTVAASSIPVSISATSIFQVKAVDQSTVKASITAISALQNKLQVSTPNLPASLSGLSRAMLKALDQPSGRVPILGYSEAQVKALAQLTGKVPVNALAMSQVKSLANTPQLPAAVTARSVAQVKALAQLSGKVGLTAFTEAMVKSLAVASLVTAGAQALVALSALMVKAAAQPSGKVGITGAAEAQVKALPSIGGSTALSARTSALVKALASTPLLRAALSATAVAQVKEQASPAGRLTLTALSTTQVKSNALATTTSNFLALVGTLTAQTKSALGNPPTIQILSSGRWISPEEVISSIARKYGRLGGLASANSRTAAQRSLLASIAAAHRWQK